MEPSWRNNARLVKQKQKQKQKQNKTKQQQQKDIWGSVQSVLTAKRQL